VWDLRQAVAIMGTAQLGAKLTDPEIDSVTTFLRTLTGDQPKIELTHLPPHTKDTPLPIVEVTPEGTVKPEGTEKH
jgi:cytochrome c peroxidase